MLGLPPLSALPSAAAWLSVCEPPSGVELGGGYRATYYDTSGPAAQLLVTPERPEGCASVEIDVPDDGIRWAGLIDRSTVDAAPLGFALQGIPEGDQLRVSEIVPIRAPQPPGPPLTSPLPLGQDLLTRYVAAPIGDAERARLTANPQGVELRCAAGTRTAGASFGGLHAHLPQGVPLALEVEYSATGSFAVALSDPSPTAGSDRRAVGDLAPQGTHGVRRVDLPEGLQERPGPIAWSLLCPLETARLDLRSFRLVATSPQASTPARAAWAWDAASWRDAPGHLLDRLRRTGADTVFLSVPMSAPDFQVVDDERLQSFVSRARASGVEVWAVEGDPYAVLAKERPKFVRRARALADYNRRAPVDARLAGVQFDIEPYLVPGYHLDTQPWLRAYLETVAELRAAAKMHLDLALPFWWAEQEWAGGRLLDALAPLVESITVMNYRTDPDLIRQTAEPFLAWGGRAGREVRIGLEAGPLPDEARQHYYKSDAGALWLLSIGTRSVLILHGVNQPNPHGPAYAYSHTTPVPGSRISFHSDYSKLMRTLPTLEDEWAAWPAFSGVALHKFAPPE